MIKKDELPDDYSIRDLELINIIADHSSQNDPSFNKQDLIRNYVPESEGKDVMKNLRGYYDHIYKEDVNHD